MQRSVIGPCSTVLAVFASLMLSGPARAESAAGERQSAGPNVEAKRILAIGGETSRRSSARRPTLLGTEHST